MPVLTSVVFFRKRKSEIGKKGTVSKCCNHRL